MRHLRRRRVAVHAGTRPTSPSTPPRRCGPTGDPSVFEVDVHPLWTVGDKPNGGYLLALLGRAARTAGQGDGGPALGDRVVVHHVPPAARSRSRRRSHHRACAGAVRRRRSARSWARTARTWWTPSSWSRASRRRCTSATTGSNRSTRRARRVRPVAPADPRPASWSGCSKRPTSAWTRGPSRSSGAPRPGRRGGAAGLDPLRRRARSPTRLALLFLVDAVPPATLRIGSSGWVPTLQMSVYVRARPAPWLARAPLHGNLVADGMVDETCVLWDERRHVVAQATQLARLRFPDET